MLERNTMLMGDVVIAITKRFYARIEKRERNRKLLFFEGWLENFKNFYDIKSYTRYGEDLFVDILEHTQLQMAKIKDLI